VRLQPRQYGLNRAPKLGPLRDAVDHELLEQHVDVEHGELAGGVQAGQLGQQAGTGWGCLGYPPDPTHHALQDGWEHTGPGVVPQHHQVQHRGHQHRTGRSQSGIQ